MKKVILFLFILAAGGIGVYYWKFGQSATDSLTREVATAEARRSPIVQSVSTTGRVVANLDVEIKCKASGEIITLPFDVSDSVNSGELLVELDPVDEQRTEKQAEVALRASKARLTQAQENLKIAQENLATEKKKAESALKASDARYQDAKAKSERLAQLLEKKLTSQEEYETAKTSLAQAAADFENAQIRIEELATQKTALELKRQDVALAKTEVESNEIALSIARQRVRDTKVYAPIDGVVAVRNVQKGQIISSGISNVGGGTTVMILSDLTRIFVLASVDESDIGKVQLKQPVRISVDAFPQMRFGGEVARISTRGVNSSGVVTFEVKIEVHSKNKSMLKPEMTANVDVVIDEDERALQIPADAVSRREGKTIVQVVKPNGGPEERVVEVGISDGVNIQVKKGLNEGETVIVRKSETGGRWSGGPQPPPGGFMGMGGPPPGGGSKSQGQKNR